MPVKARSHSRQFWNVLHPIDGLSLPLQASRHCLPRCLHSHAAECLLLVSTAQLKCLGKPSSQDDGPRKQQVLSCELYVSKSQDTFYSSRNNMGSHPSLVGSRDLARSASLQQNFCRPCQCMQATQLTLGHSPHWSMKTNANCGVSPKYCCWIDVTCTSQVRVTASADGTVESGLQTCPDVFLNARPEVLTRVAVLEAAENVGALPSPNINLQAGFTCKAVRIVSVTAMVGAEVFHDGCPFTCVLA